MTEDKLEEMLDYCVEFAKQMLLEHGEFKPFGIQVLSDGKLEPMMIYTDDQDADIAKQFKEYDHIFASEATEGNIIGCALATNVDIPERYNPEHPDGIKIRYETSSDCDQIYIPYLLSKKGLLKKRTETHLSEPFYVTTSAKWFHASNT